MKRAVVLVVFLFLFLNNSFSFLENNRQSLSIYIGFFNIDTKNLYSYPKEVINLLYEPLFTVNQKENKLIPVLAESWRIYEKGKVWFFKLRNNVKWADGKDFSADDVVYSFADLKEKGIIAEKVSNYVVKIIFPDFTYPFYGRLPLILPAHIKSEYRIGTGPFYMKEYIPNKEISFEKNIYYWRKDKANNQLPYLDRITISLENRDVDIKKIEEKDLKNISSYERDYNIYNLGLDFLSDVLLINQNPYAPIPKYKLKLFQNVNFRRALSHAINREKIIEKVYWGYAGIRENPIHPLSCFYTKNIFEFNYNLDLARNLLESLGLRDRDKDGYLEDLSGNKLEFEVLVNHNEIVRKIAEIIKDDFEKLGIKLTISDKNNINIYLYQTFNWELILTRYDWGIYPEENSNVFLSKGDKHFWFPYQRRPYFDWEKELDILFNNYLVGSNLTTKKINMYKLQRLWSNKVPLITITSPYVIYMAKKDINNFKPDLFLGPLWNSYELF
ncbi:MAG: hypothetical protein CBR30_02560 [Dictyoglomus sp. NZ13-RE01]|nr:MAG: hypothetical protein CBR30_02560 [Dictyoglomus sp. NZ13-RE01]